MLSLAGDEWLVAAWMWLSRRLAILPRAAGEGWPPRSHHWSLKTSVPVWGLLLWAPQRNYCLGEHKGGKAGRAFLKRCDGPLVGLFVGKKISGMWLGFCMV